MIVIFWHVSSDQRLPFDMMCFAVCMFLASANSDEAISLLQPNAQAAALADSWHYLLVPQDEYWGCSRRGVANQHGFGHNSLGGMCCQPNQESGPMWILLGVATTVATRLCEQGAHLHR